MGNATEKRDQKRRMIFDAAMRLMQDRSYEDVTIKDICQEANISNGMFFYYFKTKDELLSLYLTEAYDEYLAEHEPDDTASDDFIKKIIDLYDCYINYCEDTGIQFISSFYSPGNKALNTHDFSGARSMNTTMMRDLGYLMTAQQKGYLKPDANPIQATIDCCSIVKGIIFEWCICEGSFDPLDSAHRILRNYLESLATEKHFAEFGNREN